MSVDVGSAVGYLDLDINGFLSGLKTAQSEAKSGASQIADNLSSGFQTVGNQISSVGSTMTKGLTVPLVGLGTLATTTAATFEKSMSQVQATMGITSTSMTTLDGVTVNTMDALSALAKEMGATTKFSAQEAAEAINNMAMAGYDTEQIYKALPEVLNLASAGALDLDYATQLAANGLNVMGLEVGDLAEMSDKMAVTASSAYGSVADFGEGLLVAGGQAKLANLSLTDTFTALGILGDNGISASEGGTMLRNTLKNLYTPTDSAAKALERLGVETKTADGELIDIQTVLKTLKGSLDNLTEAERIEAMAQIFDTRTIAGANALLENSSERWDELSLAIDGAEGAAGRMADTQLDNLSGQMTILKSSLEGLAIAFGELLMPTIKKVVEAIQNFVTWLNNLDEEQKEQIIQIAAVVAALGPLLLIIGKTITGIGTLIKSVTTIGGAITKIKGAFTALGATATASGGTVGAAFTAALGPIAAVVAIIAVLGAAFATLWKNNEEFRNKMTAIWDSLKEKFAAFTEGIVERINALGFDFKNIVEVLKAVWEGFCNFLAPIFEGIWQQVVNILSGVMDVLLGVLDIFIGIFTGDWEKVWDGVKGIFSAVWEFVKNTFINWVNVFKGLANTVLGWFGTTWDETWSNVKGFFVNTWNSIKDFFVNIATSISNAVSNFVTSVVTFFKELPTKITEFITNAWNSVVQWSTNMVTKAGEMGQNFLNSVVEFFTDLPYKVGYFIGNTLTNIVIWVVDAVAKAKEMGTKFLEAIVEFFTQLPGKVLQFITSALENVKQWVTDMVTKAKELGQQFLDNIVSFFTQLPGKVLGFITSTFENVKMWTTNMVNKAKEMATNFINNVVNTLTSLPGKVKGFLDSAIENVKTWVTDMGRKGLEAIQALLNNIVEGAKAIPAKMAEIGRNIVEGVWQGIQNAASWFTNQVKGFFSGIVDGVKGALGIGSPSKVFAKEIGRWMPAGVAVGFESAMPAATKDIQNSLNDGIDSIKPDDIDINAKASVTGFATKFKDIYTDVVVWFESIESRINRSINRMTESLAQLLQVGQMIVNPDGSLGYIGYNGFGPRPRNNDPANPERNPNGPGGDTFNFYSPKPLSEIEAARQMKQAKRDLAEGF